MPIWGECLLPEELQRCLHHPGVSSLCLDHPPDSSYVYYMGPMGFTPKPRKNTGPDDLHPQPCCDKQRPRRNWGFPHGKTHCWLNNTIIKIVFKWVLTTISISIKFPLMSGNCLPRFERFKNGVLRHPPHQSHPPNVWFIPHKLNSTNQGTQLNMAINSGFSH